MSRLFSFASGGQGLRGLRCQVNYLFHKQNNYLTPCLPYLKDAARIVITDPYVRYFFQARNLMELLETIAGQKPDEEEVEVHLVTAAGDFSDTQQIGYLEKMKESCASIGIVFSWEFADAGTLHARHIVTDHGWKILLDRGLDVFQPYEMKDAFAVSNRVQRYRSCKGFEITFLKSEGS